MNKVTSCYIFKLFPLKIKKETTFVQYRQKEQNAYFFSIRNRKITCLKRSDIWIILCLLAFKKCPLISRFFNFFLLRITLYISVVQPKKTLLWQTPVIIHCLAVNPWTALSKKNIWDLLYWTKSAAVLSLFHRKKFYATSNL